MPVEEQIQIDSAWPLYAGLRIGMAQRLTVPNREISKLGFWLTRDGAPPGDITFVIRRTSDDGVIVTKVWGLASDVPLSVTYEEITWDSPVTIDEEVRVAIFYTGGDGSNNIKVSFKGSDVKADEIWSQWTTSWGDNAGRDCAYRYTYEEAAGGIEDKSANMGAKMLAAGLI